MITRSSYPRAQLPGESYSHSIAVSKVFQNSMSSRLRGYRLPSFSLQIVSGIQLPFVTWS